MLFLYVTSFPFSLPLSFHHLLFLGSDPGARKRGRLANKHKHEVPPLLAKVNGTVHVSPGSVTDVCVHVCVCGCVCDGVTCV